MHWIKKLLTKRERSLKQPCEKVQKMCLKICLSAQDDGLAIMFLATEGLYAEATRRPELLETLQREYKVVVAGPLHFAALLNSLQMGLYACNRNENGEVWNLLSLIRTEFYKFGAVLEKTQKKMRCKQ